MSKPHEPRAGGDFIQQPPRLGNTYDGDRVLRSALKRILGEALPSVEPDLRRLGELAGGELYELQLADRLNEPVLERWSAWGERVDRIEPTQLWRRAAEVAARHGLVWAGYRPDLGARARVDQFARVYLFTASSDIYSCPLAMTDGAARTLLDSGHDELIERAAPRLLSADPERAWTSGQWMTETSGGSDVGRSLTEARLEEGGWRLYGRKWFTSAISSQMALTLARPAGGAAGSRGLALFYLETRDAFGRPNALRVLRLKDKLGTRKVPTAELLLEGVPAIPVYAADDPQEGLTGGVRRMATMLNITRVWNAISSISLAARGLALARDYAHKRVAFGAPLAEKPLHVDTLAGLQAEFEGAFHLAFRVAELLGAVEHVPAENGAADRAPLLRLLTPIAKLTTAKQAVAIASEVLEAFGGAGYVEDTGLPQLLRDSQVLPIWEGTTNVLALDLLRALQGGGVELLQREIERCLDAVEDPGLQTAAETVERASDRFTAWLSAASAGGRQALEAGARRFALTAGRTLELALLLHHAQWSLDHEGDDRSAAAARLLAARGVDVLAEVSMDDARRVLG